MFTNLLLVTILILVAWIIAVVYYLYTSKQHEDIEQEIDALQSLLDQNGQDG